MIRPSRFVLLRPITDSVHTATRALDLDRRALGWDGGGAPKKVASASAAAVRSIRCLP